MRALSLAALFGLFGPLVHAITTTSTSPSTSSSSTAAAACSQDNLLRALLSSTRLADSSQFCSAFLSLTTPTVTATTTTLCVLSTYAAVNSTISPLYLYNLQPLTTSATPLKYDSKTPSPSTIPGGPQSYAIPTTYASAGHRKRDGDLNADAQIAALPTEFPGQLQDLARRQAISTPSYIASTYPPSRLTSACSCMSLPTPLTKTITPRLLSTSTTTTCTNYVPTSTATYANYCAPGLQVNAPQPNPVGGYIVTALFPVASKLDCCAACGAVFNCAWWKFDFGTVGNGYAPGMCHYAYYTGTKSTLGSQQVAVCPNGMTRAISTAYPGQLGREANNNDPGYNAGACGGGYDIFESSQDSGAPDDYYLHYCGVPGSAPVASPVGCV